jgi:UDPglucose 6-dehydrogenase/UDP-N-acetyl-D-galactosamine dehydrogenase
MVSKKDLKDKIICIVGLGYVGLPLMKAFSKHFKVIGFDINKNKINILKNRIKKVELTSDPKLIKKADFIIICVPTPISKSKEPDLSYVKKASIIVGKNLKRDAIVVLESTVYPSVTEEIVGPILEKESKLILGKDFKIGYSPERVNPGDKNHTVENITKIVAGIDDDTANILLDLYGKITKVFKAKDIKTAEAAKVIENIQRDLNIALMNEFSIIFSKMGLDIKDVLDAASTKWNFHSYIPGLVGGHCIPVDPYYLVYKAKQLDYHPQVILAGRSVNDFMSKHVVDLTIKSINKAGKIINGSKILIMGLTFKENVSDTRQTPVQKIISGLKDFNCDLYGYDPLLDESEIKNFGINSIDDINNINVDCVIITVSHDVFKNISLDDLKKIMYDKPIIVDVKRMFDKENAYEKGFLYTTF